MQENTWFQKALADFTHEAASGGAIRHLADTGYTVAQIMEALDFPTPYEKVRREVWAHLLKTGVILREEPGSVHEEETVSYVREYDRYGKATFRRVTNRERREGVVCWKKQVICSRTEIAAEELCDKTAIAKEELGSKAVIAAEELGGKRVIAAEKLYGFLRGKIERNREDSSYLSCDFGLALGEDSEGSQKMLSVLEGRDREYMEGLPWERRRVYHRLTPRMLGILVRLYEAGYYCGNCYFLKTEEMVEVRS